MKRLVDEMWWPEIAEQLRRRGHDVEAVVMRDDLRTEPDDTIFRVAQNEGCVLLTENVDDFRVIAARVLLEGGHHYGLIFTSHHRFPRDNPRTLGRVVSALDALLSGDISLRDTEYWLR